MSDENSFLGTGWHFPPAFDRRSATVKMVSGREDIRQCLEILLATDQGDRNMHPDFGCGLNRFVFHQMDQAMITRIKTMVSDAILYHEPRIDLDNISVTADDHTRGIVLISIDYTIRETNSRHNLVYPFYLTEGKTSF